MSRAPFLPSLAFNYLTNCLRFQTRVLLFSTSTLYKNKKEENIENRWKLASVVCSLKFT